MRTDVAAVTLAITLQAASVRRADAEDRVDFKYMWYQEDNDRIRVVSPAVLLETDLSPTLTLKIQGVYNAISGASPTGAPPVKSLKPGQAAPVYVTQPYSVYVEDADDNEHAGTAVSPQTIQQFFSEEEHEGESEGERGDRGRSVRSRAGHLTLAPRAVRGFHARAGATPAPSPIPSPTIQVPQIQQNTSQPGQTVTTTRTVQQQQTAAAAPAPASKSNIPLANVEDERTAVNLALTKKLEQHEITGGFAYSTEQDYESMAVSLSDAVSFNEKNTTLSLGTAYTHDSVDVLTRNTTDSKDTVELFLGLTQVINPTTLFNASLTLGKANGYLDDQYKVVSLNGVIVPEHRPDTKDKKIVFMSLSHLFKSIRGTAELGWRYYDDSFGVSGNTATFAWYQRLGNQFILRPTLRYYVQEAADFYGVSFTGTPEFYSSDYRISSLEAIGYGLGLIWKPSDNWSFDIGAERYEQSGRDGVTDEAVYPKATIFTAGARWWF